MWKKINSNVIVKSCWIVLAIIDKKPSEIKFLNNVKCEFGWWFNAEIEVQLAF